MNAEMKGTFLSPELTSQSQPRMTCKMTVKNFDIFNNEKEVKKEGKKKHVHKVCG